MASLYSLGQVPSRDTAGDMLKSVAMQKQGSVSMPCLWLILLLKNMGMSLSWGSLWDVQKLSITGPTHSGCSALESWSHLSLAAALMRADPVPPPGSTVDLVLLDRVLDRAAPEGESMEDQAKPNHSSCTR